jgi:transposase
VVAASLIRKRPGDRIKTDRRNACNLAKLHRVGELTAVWVPDPGHAARRDVVRALRRAAAHILHCRNGLGWTAYNGCNNKPSVQSWKGSKIC